MVFKTGKWKFANTRTAFGEALLELGRNDRDIVALNADLSSSTKTSVFAAEYPDRFFNAGIAEANMMGMAAGLAVSGKIVFASTFAMFATGRAYDQIRQSIAYPGLNVKIIATHGGITVGGDGASHQMCEDIALMSVLPNMRVIVPCDYMETKEAIMDIAYRPGPFYIRLGRADVPMIYDENYDFKLGKANVLRDGSDITIAATGIMVSIAIEAANILALEGIDARVLNISTIKPMDVEALEKAARDTAGIVTAEEHNYIMGFGSLVATHVSERYPTLIKKVGIPDRFGESGESWELMKKFGLTSEHICAKAKEILKEVRS